MIQTAQFNAPVLENPNHHLWLNNRGGFWFIHYTIYPTPATKERVRKSLGTKDLALARERRDKMLAELGISVKTP